MTVMQFLTAYPGFNIRGRINPSALFPFSPLHQAPALAELLIKNAPLLCKQYLVYIKEMISPVQPCCQQKYEKTLGKRHEDKGTRRQGDGSFVFL
jgi:hypothetical protein